MSQNYIQVIDKLDPTLKTGPTRIMSGIGRTLTPTLDVNYGEFMTWLYVGVTGNISAQNWDGTTTVYVGLAAGVFHPIYTTKINSTGTTATNIIVGS